jgi:ribosomal protein L40E
LICIKCIAWAAGHIPTAMKCRECSHEPREFEGHPGLGPLLGQRPPEGTAFACMLCGARWLRRHAGDGNFVWVPWDPARQR